MLRRSKGKAGAHPITDMAFPDVARFGAFVGLFLSSFECGMLLLDMFGSPVPQPGLKSRTWSFSGANPLILAEEKSCSWRARLRRVAPFIIGGFSGLALYLAPADTRMPIALFFGVRAFEVLCRLGVNHGVVMRIPHADTALMALASAQVIYAWFYEPGSLDPGYRRFLDHQGGRPVFMKDAFARWVSREAIDPEQIDKMNAHRSNLGLAALAAAGIQDQNGCAISHPETPFCTLFVLRFFCQSFMRALPVYIPVYLLPLVIFKSSKLVSDPVNVGHHVLAGILRSSGFLASYCSVAWFISCWARPFVARSRLLSCLAGFGAGTTVLAEKKPRRIELGLYVFTQALQSTFRLLKSRGTIGDIVGGDIALFVGAAAVIMYCYVREPTTIRPGYFSLLRWYV